MRFRAHTGNVQHPFNILGLFFTKGSDAGETALLPGQCSRIDRGIGNNEPDILQQEVPPDVNTAPWFNDLKDPSKFWTFKVFNTNQGVFKVTSAFPSSPPVGGPIGGGAIGGGGKPACGTGPACVGGSICCGGRCVANGPTNCGRCGNRCGSGSICQGQQCIATGPSGPPCANVGDACVPKNQPGTHCCQDAGPELCVFGTCKACIPHDQVCPAFGTQVCCDARNGDQCVLDQSTEQVKCNIPDADKPDKLEFLPR